MQRGKKYTFYAPLSYLSTGSVVETVKSVEVLALEVNGRKSKSGNGLFNTITKLRERLYISRAAVSHTALYSIH